MGGAKKFEGGIRPPGYGPASEAGCETGKRIVLSLVFIV